MIVEGHRQSHKLLVHMYFSNSYPETVVLKILCVSDRIVRKRGVGEYIYDHECDHPSHGLKLLPQ